MSFNTVIIYKCIPHRSAQHPNHSQVKWLTVVTSLQCNVLLGKLGSWIYVNATLTRTAHPNNAADQEQPLTVMAFLDSSETSMVWTSNMTCRWWSGRTLRPVWCLELFVPCLRPFLSSCFGLEGHIVLLGWGTLNSTKMINVFNFTCQWL